MSVITLFTMYSNLVLPPISIPIFDVPADDRDPAYAGKTAAYNEAGIVATPLDDIRALGKKRNE